MGHLEKRLTGKLLKKSNVLVNKISLVDFNFKQLAPIDTVYPDNTFKSVIYQKLHEEQDLQAVKMPMESFDSELIDPKFRLPINLPKNFTADWLRYRERMRRRNPYDEEEEYEPEGSSEAHDLSTPATQTSPQYASAVPQTHLASVENAFSKGTTTPANTSAVTSNAHHILEQLKAEQTGKMDKMEQLDAMGKVIARIADEQLAPKTEASTSITSRLQTQAEDDLDHGDPMHQEFVPMTAKSSAHHEPELKVDQQKLESLYDESKAKGFEDGFREGEQKGLLQIQAIADEVFQHLTDIITELQQLKKQIMVSAQDNFYEITQALAESLLDHEFSIKPDAFAHLIQKAVKQTINDDKFTVRVSSKAYNNLKKTGQLSLLPSLKADDTLHDYEFKIDSAISAVEANPKKIIASLLDQADMNLFLEEAPESTVKNINKAG